MPNIIEQQDLLKGLPDNRLALLMQNPSNDIPPFLVAAEAQRRQSVRQQYAGAQPNESVVDSLTKQMASVPQNVQAPMQTPPRMPPPMQMPQQAGIGAIRQGMAGGGMVQRYYDGGQIKPMWKMPDMSGVFPSIGGAISDLYGWATTPYSQRNVTEEAPASDAITTPDIKVPPRNPAFDITGEPAEYTDMTPAKPKAQPNPTTGTNDTSDENKSKAESAAYRKQIEELFGVSEPSNWEEAQKWFAMSAQIMNPDANLMQGLANAGSVYSEAEAQQAREKRAGELELKKALLQYDIGERDYGRQVAAQNRSDKIEAMKYQAGFALKEAELYRKAADDAADALNRQVAAISSANMAATPEEIAKDPTVKALQDRVNKANKALRNATIRSQGFNTMFGNVYGLPPGFEASDGDSIFNIGG